jgi:hypothetical protein
MSQFPLRTGKRICFHGDMIRKVLTIIGSAVFLVIAPGFVAGLVPWWISSWRLESPFFGMALLRLAGGMLVILWGDWTPGFFCPIRSARRGHAGVGLPNPPSGRYRTISICPKPDVRSRGEHDSRARRDSRKRDAP